MLKELVGSSPLKDRIITKDDLFEKKNPKLIFHDSSETLEITTDYCNPFELRVAYDINMVPEILNPELILREKGNSIYMKRYVEIKKDRPFTIFFEVTTPRKGSWLIYTNK